MSHTWPGGLIRQTPVTPTGPFQSGTAPGVWTLAEAAYWTRQGLWPTAGNFLAVEDVFSTWLYTGNGSTQTITNGINLSANGGLVWNKARNAAQGHALNDTARGAGYFLQSNSSSTGFGPNSAFLSSFNSNGFTLGSDNTQNGNGTTMVSWTFRKSAGFFDVVTYTGTGSARTISHSLGVAPGCIFVKRTDTTGDWQVYHRSTGASAYTVLNSTAAQVTGNTDRWNATAPTASVFSVGTDATVNASGGTYVAYLFAHDAASTGIIQCGSCLGTASVNLGYEPQWVLVKSTTTAQDWYLFDTMRGLTASVPSSTETGAYLWPNSAAAETAFSNGLCSITSTGFDLDISSAQTYIYIAIRRGPMRTPTVGTSVFSPYSVDPAAVNTAITTNFPVDLMFSGQKNSNNASDNWAFVDRLRGATASTSLAGADNKVLFTTSTAVEGTKTFPYAYNWWNTGVVQGTGLNGASVVYYFFRRAPGFFDEVCYTGTGSAQTISHNLGAVPQLIIVKRRDAVADWQVYSAATGASAYTVLNTTAAQVTGNTDRWNATTPTASVFSVGTAATVNANGGTYVAYLFGSVSGVSSVGTYTGNGSSQTINCGFTTGARYFLVKRTNATGDWWVWDSARGIVAANDPALALNSNAAEVTGVDAVDPTNAGIIVNQEATFNINVNGATYIYLAIA